MPFCDGMQCGDDFCGGTCGTCPDGHKCEFGTCIVDPCPGLVPEAMGMCCNGPLIIDCAFGGPMMDCTQLDPTFACGWGKIDPFLDGLICTAAPEDPPGSIACPGCVTDCAGKECGPDGCGGFCGVCPADQTCQTGACVSAYTCAEYFPCNDLCAPNDHACTSSCYALLSSAALDLLNAWDDCVLQICPDPSPPECGASATAGPCATQAAACLASGPGCVTNEDCQLSMVCAHGVCKAQEICGDGIDNDFDGSTDVECCGDDTCDAIEDAVSCLDDCGCKTAAECDDGEVCTDDSCAGVCQNTHNTASCEDGDACTTGDVCTAGSCAGTDTSAADCDDQNPCTDDTCDPVTGCTHPPNTVTCDDGDLCTTGDVCGAGTCAGQPMDCDDQDACTDDACVAGACVHAHNTAPCQDGDGCTENDLCADGACVGGPKMTCAPANACEDPWCVGDPSGLFGYCETAPKQCYDGNVCTTDTCDLDSGCVFVPLVGGEACTNGVGLDGVCAQLLPDDPPFCFVFCTQGTDCDDQNACTDDTCDPMYGSCVNPPNTASCDDGDACTTGDVCSVGECIGQHMICDDGNACTGDYCAGGVCVNEPGAVSCDDSNPCTDDACAPATGECGFTPNTASCDDEDACTTGDVCSGGACAGADTSATDCDDLNVCTDDTCDPATGCASTNNTAGCDDGNACTTGDVCAAGTCAGVDASASDCDDTNPCTDDTCSPATGCANTPNTAACEDGDDCTTGDVCDGGACVGQPR